MTTIHVNDSQAEIIKTALAQYAKSIREEARGHRGGYSARAIELNVLRLNVEEVIEAVHKASHDSAIVLIDSRPEASHRHAA